MTKTNIVRDCVGNELCKDDWVTFHLDRPLICKILAVEPGGLHTANGITPAVLRLYADITLRKMPGVPFVELVAVRQPLAQAVVESLAPGFDKA